MCGLVGRAVREGKDLNLADNRTARALETIRHRGPDMLGEYSDDTVWLGHSRPSILDLSDAGSQPNQFRAFITKHPEVFNSAAIQAMYDQHVSNQRDRSFLLWKLLNFMIWANRTEVSFAC